MYDIEFVKSCLQEHAVMKHVNAIARQQIIEEIDRLSEQEMSIYLPSVSNGDFIQSGSKTDSTYRAYQRLENSEIESERKSLYDQLKSIDVNEHRMKRVIIAYHKISCMMPLHYNLVDKLWFSNNRKTSIHILKKEMNRGATTLYQMLEDVVEAVCCITNSAIQTQSIGKAKQDDLFLVMPKELVVRICRHERMN